MQSRSLVVAVFALFSLTACPGRAPNLGGNVGVRVDAGVADADAGVADGGIVYKSCATEDDCAYLGPGHMCMNSGCMLMDINAPPVIVPAPSEQDTSIATLTDIDPDPAVFEAALVAEEDELEIVPGTTTSTWLYKDENGDGSVHMPGPAIDVPVGTEVKVHFTNHLPMDTTIHWHGLTLPNSQDGPGMDGFIIHPGDTFDFDFTPTTSSLFWFHPHVRGDIEIERGLYAPFIVRAPDEPVVGVDVDRERVLVLDDILLDDANQIVPDALEESVMEPDGKMTFEGMMGRQGNRLLVNGRINPFLDVTAGTVERWRILDTANSRFFLLSAPGVQFVVIGTDGGLVPVPKTVDELLVSPGERYDVLVAMNGAPNDDVPMVTKHHDRGHDMADPGPLELLHLKYGATAKTPATPMPNVSRPLARIAVDAATPTKHIAMDEEVLRGGKVGFTLNNELWPNVTPLSASLGTTEVWEIENKTHMDHPFHLHGFPFQVLSTQKQGGPVVDETFLANKDVVIVPPQTTLRFAVTYAGFAGMWMFHCHILEHAERGMMSMLQVQ